MATETIKEFLIALGFKVNEGQIKKFEDIIGKAGTEVASFGLKVTGMAVAVDVAVTKVASHFEDLYYVAQRTGATVSSLQAFGYAATQIGLTAGGARGAVEGLASAMRANPGMGAMLNMLGVRTQGRDALAITSDLVNQLKRMPFFMAAQYGEMLGIDPQTLFMLEEGMPQLAQAMADHADRAKQAGVDESHLGQQSHDLLIAVRKLKDEFDILGERLAVDFIDPVTKGVTLLDEFIQAINRADSATHGWLVTLGSLGVSFGGFLAIRGLFGAIFGRQAVAGAAAAAGATAAGGAVAAGGLAGAAGTAALAAASEAALVGITAAIVEWDPLGVVAREKQEHAAMARARAAGHRIYTQEDLDPSAHVPPAGNVMNWSARPASAGASLADLEAYIRQSAIRHGIDPDVAVAVAHSEGLNDYSRSGLRAANDYGTSGGPFQLHYGGSGIPGMNSSGLGDAFTRSTGLDARDPANAQASIDFALDQAAKLGWGPWHGAGRVGISDHAGIGVTAPLGSDSGGDKNVTIQQTNTFHITGDQGFGRGTADRIVDQQSRLNGDLVRNTAGAVR